MHGRPRNAGAPAEGPLRTLHTPQERKPKIVVNPSLAKRGEYQLRVHVIEARGLVGRDAGGTCDPQVYTRHVADA